MPQLVSLLFNVEDRSGAANGSKHIRRVVLDRAPALFLVPCGDPRCTGDEHDLTSSVMNALHSRKTEFHGDDECNGSVGTSPCSRILKFDAVAEYRP